MTSASVFVTNVPVLSSLNLSVASYQPSVVFDEGFGYYLLAPYLRNFRSSGLDGFKAV